MVLDDAVLEYCGTLSCLPVNEWGALARMQHWYLGCKPFDPMHRFLLSIPKAYCEKQATRAQQSL